MTIAVLGLGGNIGDRRANLSAAIEGLSEQPGLRIAAVSALYETPPWGKTDQPAFLNAAVRVETSLSARELLDTVLRVERRLGRDRRERWGPRNVDIDILLFGDERIDEPGLTIPHPHLHERVFALKPLADVMPDAIVDGHPVPKWLEQLDGSGITRVVGQEWAAGPQLSRR